MTEERSSDLCIRIATFYSFALYTSSGTQCNRFYNELFPNTGLAIRWAISVVEISLVLCFSRLLLSGAQIGGDHLELFNVVEVRVAAKTFKEKSIQHRQNQEARSVRSCHK